MYVSNPFSATTTTYMCSFMDKTWKIRAFKKNFHPLFYILYLFFDRFPVFDRFLIHEKVIFSKLDAKVFLVSRLYG